MIHVYSCSTPSIPSLILIQLFRFVPCTTPPMNVFSHSVRGISSLYSLIIKHSHGKWSSCTGFACETCTHTQNCHGYATDYMSSSPFDSPFKQYFIWDFDRNTWYIPQKLASQEEELLQEVEQLMDRDAPPDTLGLEILLIFGQPGWMQGAPEVRVNYLVLLNVWWCLMMFDAQYQLADWIILNPNYSWNMSES